MDSKKKPPDQREALQAFANVVDDIVMLRDEREGDGESLINAKMDAIERAIQSWRYYAEVYSNNIEFEDFISSDEVADHQEIEFRIRKAQGDYGTGKAAAQYQAKLLLFLLLNHCSKRDIVDTITEFVQVVRGDLSVIDFKLQKTGSYRCVTNIRFCTNALRECGLLKVSETEKYKAWVLSLPGLILAARILKGTGSWGFTESGKKVSSGLHVDLQKLANPLATPEQLLAELGALLPPNSDLLARHDGLLRKAFGKLDSHWANLGSTSIKAAELKKLAAYTLRQVDGIEGMHEFYEEFMENIDVDRLSVGVAPARAASGTASETVDNERVTNEMSMPGEQQDPQAVDPESALTVSDSTPTVEFARSVDSSFHVALVGVVQLKNDNDEILGRKEIVASAQLQNPATRSHELTAWPAQLDPHADALKGSLVNGVPGLDPTSVPAKWVSGCRAASAKDAEVLSSVVKARAAGYIVAAMAELADQGDAEAWAMKEILEAQQRNIGVEPRTWRDAWRNSRLKKQLWFSECDDTKARRRARTQFLMKRAGELAQDLKTEPQRIRDECAVKGQTLEFVRLVYLCPNEVID